MDLEDIALSEISQTERHIPYDLTSMWILKKLKSIEAELNCNGQGLWCEGNGEMSVKGYILSGVR